MAAAIALAGVAGGCSADVTRFDFPAYGLTDEPSFSTTDTSPVPAEPLAPSYAPNEETLDYRSSREARGWSDAFSPDGAVADDPEADRVRRKPGTRNDARSAGVRDAGRYSADRVTSQPLDIQPTGRASRGPTEQRTRAVRVEPISRNGWIDRSRATRTAAPVRQRSGAPAAPVVPFETATQDGYSTSPYERREPRTVAAAPRVAAAGETIRVERGDTLYGIARRTGVSVAEITAANGLAGTTITPGQRLTIPGRTARSAPANVARRAARRVARAQPVAETVTPAAIEDDRTPGVTGARYAIRSGDSLYKIARAQGVSLRRLQAANPGLDPRRLKIGQEIIIPGAAGAPASTRGDRRIASNGPALEGRALAPRPRLAPEPVAPREPARQTAALPPRESATMTDAGPAPEVGDQALFRWPIKGRIIAGFGRRANGKFNDGIDIAAPKGAPVRASRAGTVAYAGQELEGYGKLILVRHDDDWVSAYAHNSEMLVGRGDTVARGQVIAKAGNSGGAAQPMVHFELRKGSKPVDPMKHLDR